MKRIAAFIFAFLAVCYLQATDADAQFRRECRYGFCTGGGGPTGTPISNACINSSGTTITFTAQGTGPAAASRISVVSINWSDSTLAGTAELTSVTIGGIAMTRAVRAVGDDQNSNSEIWWVLNPTGTSANIVATFSTAVDGITIETYRLTGYLGVAANTTGTTTVSQAFSNKQLAIAAASRRTNVSTSLSNMTNDFSSACGANLWGVHASKSLTGNGTLSSTISPTGNTPLIAMSVFSTAGSAFVCGGTLLPSALTGLKGWWDVSVTASLNLTGSTVNSIADQSASNYTLTGGLNAFAKPTYSATNFNGVKPGILITTAVGSAMEGTASFPIGTGNTLTWIIVAQNPQSSSNTDGRYLSYVAPGGTGNDSDNNGSWVWARKSFSATQAAFSRNAGTFVPTTINFSSGYHVFTGTVDATGQVTIYVDCDVTIAQATTSASWVSAGTLAIGHQASHLSGNYITMTWGEALVVAGVVPPAQLGQLINGLKVKWGIP